MSDSQRGAGTPSTDERPPEALGRAIARLGPVLLESMTAMEHALRRLHPPDVPALREALRPGAARLEEALGELRGAPCAPDLEGFRERLAAVAAEELAAHRGFLGEDPEAKGPMAMLLAMHGHARAQDAAWPLRRMLPPLSAWFLEPGQETRLAELDPEPDEGAPGVVGLFNANNRMGERGGFTLYVPECYDGEPWPLVMALHGGSGHGSDFLWTWLREARSRRLLLIAPTSRGSTWSLDAPEHDGSALRSMLDFVGSRWKVDRDAVLLTGLSDGATFSLLEGLAENAPYTHLAPVSGVLHPVNAVNGNLARAAGRKIRLIHGALDWMFPVDLARMAAAQLSGAGAELDYVEIEDLSHTYPREQNAAILDWFVPGRRSS